MVADLPGAPAAGRELAYSAGPGLQPCRRREYWLLTFPARIIGYVYTNCPDCGGRDLRYITPNYIECRSLKDISVPVGLFGNAMHIGGSRVCGYCFQIDPGSALMTDAVRDSGWVQCSCGRYAIGRCMDCNRALCGKHGSSGDSFLCADCFNERAEPGYRARAAAEAAATAERTAFGARLDIAADSPERVLDLLTARDASIADDVLRGAWARVRQHITHSHELVSVIGRSGSNDSASRSLRLRPKPKVDLGIWSEERRSDLWLASGAGRLNRGTHSSPKWEENLDLWLDPSGAIWRATTEDACLVQYAPEVNQSLILPPGCPFVAAPVPGKIRLYAEHGRAAQLAEGKPIDPASRATALRTVLRAHLA